MSKPTMCTYFSGGGLAESGLRDIFDVVGAVEISPAIAAHYHAVNPDVDLRVQDVCTVDPSAWAGVSYFHASPSCRNASVANQEAGECAEDRAAADAVCRGIRIMRPAMFTLENVGPYKAFDSFRMICDCLTECGYRWSWHVLNAADYSVPQTRKRLYLRAWLRPEPVPYPAPTHAERGKLDGATMDLFGAEPLLPWVGWYEALTAPRYGRDVIPTLPESRFAPWQLARLPAEITDMLLAHPSADNDRFLTRGGDEPVYTINCTTNPHRAFIVDNLATCREATLRVASEPMFTVTAANAGRRPANMPSAYLVGVQGEHGDLSRAGVPPAPAIAAGHVASKYRAVLVGGREH